MSMRTAPPRGNRMADGETKVSRWGDPDAIKASNAAAPKIPHLVRRIGELFRPHRFALTVTIVLVLISAAIGVLPPLLTQQAFDRGLFPPSGTPDVPVLLELVGAMVLIWLVSAALGVWQTYLTAKVGNSVMGALRVKLFGHLQSMELGFFTRTKTGTIQSRLQNDVGGVAGVLNTHDLERRRQHRHGHRRLRRDAAAELADDARRRHPAAGARDRPAPGRAGARPHRDQDPGVAVGDDRDHAGDPQRVGHPARQELQPAAGGDRALRPARTRTRSSCRCASR